jgi:hypothetical protein
MDLLKPSFRPRGSDLDVGTCVRDGRLATATLASTKKHLDGGGSSFGQGYIPFLKSRGMPKQQRVFEWCSGPAFIGFSILAHDYQ